MASNPSTSANMASPSNPCCEAWQDKYARMAARRALLKNGTDILQGQIRSMEIEKLNLQKAFQDQQNRADVLEEEKAKEASLRTSLEEEVAALKSRICSNEADTNCKNELEKETLLLRESISQKEGEIQQLKKLLEEGNSGSVKGKKVSPSDKKKIAELQKNLKSEKNRADEACELVDAANRKSEEDRNLVETLNNEIAALKSRICSTEADVNCKNNELEKESVLLRDCISEKEGEIEQLKKRLEEGNSGSVKGKKISPTDKKKIAELQKTLKTEKNRADEACKLVDAAKRKSEEDENLVETLNNEVKNITEKLEETNRMFETERQSAVIEKKKADEEKAKANELRKIVEVNERKAADEKFRADNLSLALEEEKKKFQILQKELHEVTSNQNSALSSQLDELEKILEIEKEKVVVQKQCAEHEKFEKEEHKKAAEASMEKAMEEKSRADKLLEDLLSTRLIIENLQQELTKVNHMLEAERLVSAKEKQRADDLSLKSKEQQIAAEVEMSQLDKLRVKLEEEKKKVASEKKRADLEMSAKEELKKAAEANAKKAMEEKHLADKLSQDLQCGTDRIESLEVDLNKVKAMLDAERLVLANERNDADALKSKLEEQARIATENEKRAMEEESRSNKMVQELENARQKLRDVEIQLCEVKQCRDLAGASSTPTELLFNKQMSAKVSFLQEQLKFEKKRVKHYKEVAKLEKDLKSASQQELHNVKQDFQSLLYQMDMLSDTFGARNHMNKKRRLNAGGLELPGRTPDCGLPQLNFCCDADRRPSSLSSRDTSCRPKPNSRLVDAEQPMESPSGMKINLDPLRGGSHGDILASSPLNSNTASFSDEQLLGSQERAACPPQTTIAKWNDRERIATVAENSINPVELDSGHLKKRRKIIDESEVVRCVESQDKVNNQDAETNLFGLGKLLVQPMKEQMEKVNLLVTGNNADAISNFDLSGEKKKSTNEPQLVLQQVNNSTVLNGKEISQPNESHRSGLVVPDLDDLVSFEQQLNGNYMKLLDLDDPIAEEHFRMALQWPLSPTLPDIEPHNFDQEVEMQNLGMPVCARNIATDLNGEHDKIPKFCVVYSDMEDIGCITRIFGTTTTCMARLCSSLQKPWLVEDILLALVSEQDLVSREMICVFFSLLLLNFASASCAKSVDFQSLSDTFCANLQSVLLNMDKRHLFAKVCCLGDFLSLSENFLLHKKILMLSSLTSDTLNCGDSNIEILHQGESNVLRSSLASTNMVVAGSLILASISAAAGLVDSICEFSLKVIKMRRADCLMTSLILHTFAYVCGKEYFTINNYHVVMEAVKVIVASLEGSLAINENSQPDDGTLQHCFPCEKCPFADRSICLDDVSSKLIEEVQAFTDPHNQADTFDSRFLVAILSALELLATHMSWGWVCDKVVSKLFETLESCDPQSIMSTAVVTLLGDLGRLGVETRGYDDPGVKSIVQRLSASLHRTSSSKHNTFSMTVVQSLTQLHPNGAEVFLKNNEESVKGAHPDSSTATSDILRTMFSSLSNKPTSALHNCVIPDIIA